VAVGPAFPVAVHVIHYFVMPKFAERFFTFSRRMSRLTALLLGFVLMGMVWILEYVTGPEVSVSIFFIIPIALVVWRVGSLWAVVTPILASVAWWTAELATGRVYSHWEIGFWNSLVRLGFFLIFAKLIMMRKNYIMEKTARQQAEEVSELKSKMIALVSHEYSNILTHLKLATYLLRESEPAPLPKSRESSYAMLERAIEHLRGTTVNFLSLNRLESGQLLLNIRPTPIRSVAAETLLLMQPLIESKRLRLEVDFPPAPVPVKADPDALSIIMSNLITNAIKYTNAGTITVRISREYGPPERALFEVQDTGIGISDSDSKQVLAGFRAEESRKVAKGFGIGLGLAKELIERHGSHLEIESELGKGSRFYFYLPLWQGPSDRPPL
jgi:signal transduction histidine kinase